MTNFWIVFIVPVIVVSAADQQRTTINFPAAQQPTNVGMQSQGNVGLAVGADTPLYPSNNNNMAYYQNRELQGGPSGAIFPPEQVPNFYFNAGFNKGLGFRIPDALTGASYYGAGHHTPLGDLWASKAELLPAIFKTGFFITAIIAILKVVVFLIQAKHNLFVSASAAPAVVPISVVAADRADDKRVKRDASASPAVDSQTDFDQILAQLETIRSHFEHSFNN